MRLNFLGSACELFFCTFAQHRETAYMERKPLIPWVLKSRTGTEMMFSWTPTFTWGDSKRLRPPKLSKVKMPSFSWNSARRNENFRCCYKLADRTLIRHWRYSQRGNVCTYNFPHAASPTWTRIRIQNYRDISTTKTKTKSKTALVTERLISVSN